ncbi:MAG: N-acyl-D-amino-acid deacylase [Frankiaceae bacterium]|nr:N-acyl-D-amino-acid deacylase [Frankiaceae bacterium]
MGRTPRQPAGRVAAIGDLTGADAASAVDVSGCLVLPGFIDAHVHGDAAVLQPAAQLAALRQGVTTFVIGQDGLSYAPASARTRRYVDDYFAAINGAHPALPSTGPVSVADLLATYDRTTAINTAYLLPQGTIRYEVMGGADRAPTGAEAAAMLALVETGLDEGAVGLSTGLEYVPSGYADAPELAQLAGPLAVRALPFVAHLRGYEDRAPAAMAELRDVARRSGVALHASHYHGPADLLAPLVDGLLDDGIDVTFDSYPYLRGATTVAMPALPRWLAGDVDTVVAALGEPAVLRRLATEWYPAKTDLWPRLRLSHVPAAGWQWAEGLTVTEAAARAGRAPGEFCTDLLRATRLGAGCLLEQPPANDESAVRALLRHRAHLAGSDGIYLGSHPHPRGWGAFARFLGRHVRELGDWSWGEAAVHLSAAAARRFRLADRGILAEGAAADVVVLDPDEVTDIATYEQPRALAAGVRQVYVDGVLVLADGALTGATPGRPVRPS